MRRGPGTDPDCRPSPTSGEFASAARRTRTASRDSDGPARGSPAGAGGDGGGRGDRQGGHDALRRRRHGRDPQPRPRPHQRVPRGAPPPPPPRPRAPARLAAPLTGPRRRARPSVCEASEELLYNDSRQPKVLHITFDFTRSIHAAQRRGLPTPPPAPLRRVRRRRRAWRRETEVAGRGGRGSGGGTWRGSSRSSGAGCSPRIRAGGTGKRPARTRPAPSCPSRALAAHGCRGPRLMEAHPVCKAAGLLVWLLDHMPRYTSTECALRSSREMP